MQGLRCASCGGRSRSATSPRAARSSGSPGRYSTGGDGASSVTGSTGCIRGRRRRARAGHASGPRDRAPGAERGDQRRHLGTNQSIGCPRRELPPLGCSYPSASGCGQPRCQKARRSSLTQDYLRRDWVGVDDRVSGRRDRHPCRTRQRRAIVRARHWRRATPRTRGRGAEQGRRRGAGTQKRALDFVRMLVTEVARHGSVSLVRAASLPALPPRGKRCERATGGRARAPSPRSRPRVQARGRSRTAGSRRLRARRRADPRARGTDARPSSAGARDFARRRVND
jgi:hypothetical protein